MHLQLEGKRALVTGSTAGIGFAIAQVLASEGASVIINGRTRHRMEAAIRNLGTRVEPQGLAADLGTAAGAEEAIARFPEVEILVNNLGIYEAKPFEEIPDQDWYALVRSQRAQRSAVEPPLSPLDETTQLGTHCLHFE